MSENLSDEQKKEVGEEIVKLLNLRLDKDGRVDMGEYGTKTPTGLVKVIIRLLDEASKKSTPE
jgi:hypothetical protein